MKRLVPAVCLALALGCNRQPLPKAATTLPPSFPPAAQAPGYAAAPATGYRLLPANGLTLQATPVKSPSQNPVGLIHPPAINHRASGE